MLTDLLIISEKKDFVPVSMSFEESKSSLSQNDIPYM